MNAHYDFYESLGLDKDSSTSDLKDSILETLEGLKRDEVPAHDARVQENSVALSVLGDDRIRSKYDARLADDSAARMGIPELRALASTGSFPDEQQQAPAYGAPSPGSRDQGSHDDQATSVIPAAQPNQPARPGEDAAAGSDSTDGDAATRYGQPAMPAQPYGGADDAAASTTGQAQAQSQQSQAPAQPRPQGTPAPEGSLKQLMDSVPGTAKGLMFTLGGIAAFGVLMALIGILLLASDSYSSVGPAIIHILSAIVAVFLIPKLLRGNDATAIIPLAGAPIALAILYLTSIVTDITLDLSRGGAIAVQALMMVAWAAAAVLAFLPDTRAWLTGTYVAAPKPVAPQPQYGAPQYGQGQQGQAGQPGHQPQFGQQAQYGQSQYGAQQQAPQFGQSQYGRPFDAPQQDQQGSQSPQFGQPQVGQSQFGQSQFGAPQQDQPFGGGGHSSPGSRDSDAPSDDSRS